MVADTQIVIAVLALSEIIAFFCALRLWRREHSWARRIGWSLVLVLPILGPLLYGGIYGRPDDDGFPPAPPLDLTRL
jgi:hypothetical protein